MNFKEDATRYPLFFIQVGLETGHLSRFLLSKSVPKGYAFFVPKTPLLSNSNGGTDRLH